MSGGGFVLFSFGRRVRKRNGFILLMFMPGVLFFVAVLFSELANADADVVAVVAWVMSFYLLP